MAPIQPFKDFMNQQYPDRGGYSGLNEIFSSEHPWEFKLNEVSRRYIKSRHTATIWYRKWKTQEELDAQV